MRRRLCLIAILLGAVVSSASAFIIPAPASLGLKRSLFPTTVPTSATTPSTASSTTSRRRPSSPSPSALWMAADTETDKYDEEIEKIKPMKIKEIKAELEERGVDYKDLLEKAEFMQRLADARVKGITKAPPSAEEEEEKPVGGSSSSSSSGSSSSSSSSAQQQQQEKAATPPPPPPPPVSEAARMEKVLEEVMKMKVSEIKKELDLLKISHKGFFEKGEFAQALAKARLNPANSSRADNVDPNDDPSEYRFVEVKRMPKDDSAGGARGGGAGGPGAAGGRGPAGGGGRGPGAASGGGAGDPFSDIFNGARGGTGGPGGFGSMFDGFAGAGGPFGGGNPFGGAGGGGGMGGIDPSMLQSIMSNPRAQAAFSRAQQNPRIMKAFQECMRDPSAISKYANDKEISSVLNELKSVFRK